MEECPQHQDLVASSTQCGKMFQRSPLRVLGQKDSTLHQSYLSLCIEGSARPEFWWDVVLRSPDHAGTLNTRSLFVPPLAASVVRNGPRSPGSMCRKNKHFESSRGLRMVTVEPNQQLSTHSVICDGSGCREAFQLQPHRGGDTPPVPDQMESRGCFCSTPAPFPMDTIFNLVFRPPSITPGRTSFPKGLGFPGCQMQQLPTPASPNHHPAAEQASSAPGYHPPCTKATRPGCAKQHQPRGALQASE